MPFTVLSETFNIGLTEISEHQRETFNTGLTEVPEHLVLPPVRIYARIV